MKKYEQKILALIVAAACSFFFGLGQHEALGQVANCKQSCCEPLYSWWTGADTLSAQTAGATWPFGAGANTTQAILWVYVMVQTPGGCKLKANGTLDLWVWPNSTANCLKDPKTGLWPQPQAVVPNSVKGAPKLSNAGRNKNDCVVK